MHSLFIEKILPHLIEVRRHIHTNPELSFEEFETSVYLKTKLSDAGILVDHTWANTGFTCIIKGSKPGPTRALRAELDALPIFEKAAISYKSKHDGKMHACGHDVHMTCVYGAALVLNEMKDKLHGDVVLIFQPGEEKLPGGASLMIQEGLLEKYKPQYIIAQHVFPELEVGSIGLCEGQYMASADEIYITINGKGGHGALPQHTIDSVLVASQIVVALQSIVSRNANPFSPSVLTIGKIDSVGGATNVIPSQVKLEGTFRTMDEAWRSKAHSHIKRIATEIGNAFGANIEVNIEHGYPMLFNDIPLTQKVSQIAKNTLEDTKVVTIPQRMTSEDFAFFGQKVPCCFYRLGTGNQAKGLIHSVHSPYFQVDESAIEVGVKLLVELMIQLEPN